MPFEWAYVSKPAICRLVVFSSDVKAKEKPERPQEQAANVRFPNRPKTEVPDSTVLLTVKRIVILLLEVSKSLPLLCDNNQCCHVVDDLFQVRLLAEAVQIVECPHQRFRRLDSFAPLDRQFLGRCSRNAHG